MLKRQGRSARAPRENGYRLIRRHARQIGQRSETDWPLLAHCLALTFRPGDRTSTFHEKLLRPIVMSYDADGTAIPIRGYRARLSTNGRIRYGFNGEKEFCHDGRLPPAFHAAGRALNVRRNASLVDILLKMDDFCWRRCSDDQSLPTIPRLPRIMLGFAPQQAPMFEVSNNLKRLAAARLGISMAQLEGNPPLLVERLLDQTWQGILQPPGSAGNSTGLLLIDGEYCTQAHRALRIFEDFRHLVGAYTWNPARAIKPLRLDNPAPRLLASCGIDPSSDFDQAISSECIDRLEGLMRAELGDQAVRFSQEDFFDGLTNPFEPLVACCEVMSAARAKLQPYWSECTNDTDLRQALRSPQEGLRASGACRIQVLGTRPVPEPLCFSPAELERRAEIDWRVDQPSLADAPAEPSTQLQLCP